MISIKLRYKSFFENENLFRRKSIIFTDFNKKTDMRKYLSICYVVVNLLKEGLLNLYVYRESGIYSHSGGDGKEDPPVPIPNTEVKLFYAESTYG